MDSSCPKLLLVEPDPVKRQQLLAACLPADSPAAFSIDLCTRRSEALKRLSAESFDACLLPTDLDLLRAVRRGARETLCLVVSDEDCHAADARTIEAGADEVLAREDMSPGRLTRALVHGRSRRLRGDQLALEARQDPLTGLANRARLEEELDRLLLHSARSHTGFALLYIDLDYFKQINDSFGHGLGDLLLAVIANRLRRTMRQNDLIARVGGDEFVALLSDLHDPNDAALIASKIIHTLSEPITLNSHHLLISASVGIATHPAHGQTATELLQHADQALYRAKAGGRNGYTFYSPEDDSHTRENLDIEQGLRSGLLEGEFRLHYQPIVDTRNGDTVAWEALLRWQHPRLGLLTPDDFLQLAEHSGLILPMGHWVIGQALDALRQWQAAGIDCRLAINISDRELKQPRFADQLRQLLLKSKVPAHLLQLELRESTLLRHSDQASKLCHALSALGVSIWLDRFGEEYGAFGYLSRLPIQGVKLDGRHAEEDSRSGDYVRNLISLSRSMDKRIIASYIENADSARQVSDCGGDFLQGFWIGQPRPLEQVLNQSTRRSQTW
ncbi:MAG: EAL domain-containing protein [Gammaproteobacteria bacterium]|nr:EAL domain-containing protein [Gammaproteobacteria bacterium]